MTIAAWNTHVGIKGCRVIDDPVVPVRHISSLPPPSAGRICLLSETVLEEGQDHVAFSLGNAHKSSDKAWIDEDRLETGDGMHSHDRVDRLDGLSERDAVPVGASRSGLVVAGMDGAERFEVDLEWL